MGLYPLPLWYTIIYHLFFKGGEGSILEFVLEGEYRSEHHLHPQPSGGSEGWIPAQRDSSRMGKFFFLYIHFTMVTFINYLFNYLPWTFTYLFSLAFYSPLVRFSGGGECKDPSHFLFSGFVYSYLQNPFSSYTVNILNVSYYLTIERDLVQVGLMSKDPSSLQWDPRLGHWNL